MSKRLFYSFFKKVWKASFIKSNIEITLQATGIWPYDPNKTLTICTKKLSNKSAKKLHIRFASKILLSCYAMQQLVRQGELDVKDIYILVILQGSEKLAVKVDVLEFENKKLIKALKVEKQKKNRGKQLNLLNEEDNGPQLFSPSRVQTAQEFIIAKKAEKEQYRKNIEKKKEEQQKKKMQKEIEKKARADTYTVLKILKEEEKQKKKEAAVRKEAEKDAEKARRLAARPSQKNPPNGVQKNRR